MRKHKASRNTIRAALKKLEDRGLLAAVQGSGRRVTRKVNVSARLGLFARGGEFAVGQGARYFSAINEAAAQRGHTLITFSINHANHSISTDAGIGLELSQLDGAMIFAPQYQNEDIERLAMQMPVVAITHDASAVGVPSFLIDYGYHAASAVHELAQRGHRRILLLPCYNPSKARLTADIRRGFEFGRHYAGLADDRSMVGEYDPATWDAEALLQRNLEADEPFTAVLSYLDAPLISLHQTAERMRLKPPLTPSLVCLADLDAVPNIPSCFAYFRCPIDTVVADAVAHLDSLLVNATVSELYHPYYGQWTAGPDFAPSALI